MTKKSSEKYIILTFFTETLDQAKEFVKRPRRLHYSNFVPMAEEDHIDSFVEYLDLTNAHVEPVESKNERIRPKVNLLFILIFLKNGHCCCFHRSLSVMPVRVSMQVRSLI